MAATPRVDVIMDPAALAKLLRSPQGPVMRSAIRAGEEVKREAKKQVGVYRPPDAYSAANRARRPGQLRDSIVKRVVSTSKGPAMQVVAEDEIALWHHEGTRPHTIRARRKPFLVFFWPKAGKVVSFKQVSHPGTKPNRFLTEPLRRVLRRGLR
jgi:hypothetical protein